MSNIKKILSIALVLAMLIGITSTSTAAIWGATPQVNNANHESCLWHCRLPNWLQQVLYYVFFGWLWMRICDLPLPPLIGLEYDRTLVGDYFAETVSVSEENVLGTIVRYSFPQFTGMGDDTRQQEINWLIYDVAMSKILWDGSIDYWHHFEMNYVIGLTTPELISIVLYSWSSHLHGGGGINRTVHSLTFDINTMEMLELTSFINRESELTIKGAWYSDGRPFELHDEFVEGSLRPVLDSLLLSAYIPSFYVTPDSIVIAYDMSSATQIWIELALPAGGQ